MESKKEIDMVEVNLKTLISDNIIIQQKLDRFNIYLAQSNEIQIGLNDTIKNHLALIEAIGEGTKLMGEGIRELNKRLAEMDTRNQEIVRVLEEVKKELKKRMKE